MKVKNVVVVAGCGIVALAGIGAGTAIAASGGASPHRATQDTAADAATEATTPETDAPETAPASGRAATENDVTGGGHEDPATVTDASGATSTDVQHQFSGRE